MEIFKKQQSYKPIERVILFASDQDQKSTAEILYVEAIENGRIITENAKYVLPIEDSRTFNSDDGLVYAYYMDFSYLKEVQHLAEVEKNMIIEQAFLYPGRTQDLNKNNTSNLIIIGIMALIIIISLFV